MRKTIQWVLIVILTFCGTVGLTSCSIKDKSVVPPHAKEYFTLWNQCEALTALQDYVKDVTDPASKNYIREEYRIATFDMDGTFIGELYPTYFEYNLLEYRALDDTTYEAPKDVMETAMDEARDYANREKALNLGDQWREAGYHVISMRDDFKTIYGDGVVKCKSLTRHGSATTPGNDRQMPY